MDSELKALIEKEGNGKTFQYKGYDCEILRIPGSLHLCGYVTLWPEHNAFKNFHRENEYGSSGYNNIDVDVHGGLTYGEINSNSGQLKIGFDCAHLGDIAPGYEGLDFPGYVRSYKDMAYVEQELKSLVDQLEVLELEPHKDAIASEIKLIEKKYEAIIDDLERRLNAIEFQEIDAVTKQQKVINMRLANKNEDLIHELTRERECADLIKSQSQRGYPTPTEWSDLVVKAFETVKQRKVEL